jgi:hypothetical protein
MCGAPCARREPRTRHRRRTQRGRAPRCAGLRRQRRARIARQHPDARGVRARSAAQSLRDAAGFSCRSSRPRKPRDDRHLSNSGAASRLEPQRIARRGGSGLITDVHSRSGANGPPTSAVDHFPAVTSFPRKPPTIYSRRDGRSSHHEHDRTFVPAFRPQRARQRPSPAHPQRTTSGRARGHFCFATKPVICRDSLEGRLAIELDEQQHSGPTASRDRGPPLLPRMGSSALLCAPTESR